MFQIDYIHRQKNSNFDQILFSKPFDTLSEAFEALGDDTTARFPKSLPLCNTVEIASQDDSVVWWACSR